MPKCILPLALRCSAQAAKGLAVGLESWLLGLPPRQTFWNDAPCTNKHIFHWRRFKPTAHEGVGMTTYFSEIANIVESVEHSIIAVDAELRITFFNRAAEIITGYCRDEVIGRFCHETLRIDSDLFPELSAPAPPLLDIPILINKKCGNQVQASGSISTLHDTNHNPIGAVISMRNINNASMILHSVADGIFTVDENMIIQSFNRAAEELTGIPCNDAIGRNCHEIFHSNLCGDTCPVREAMQTGASIVNRSAEINDRYNKKKIISISASSLVNEEGEVIGGVETIRDLTVVHSLKQAIQEKYSFQKLISRNPVMHRLFDVMEDIAASDATVFLHGASGTGKELFAQAIHNLSPRKNGPLVTVNCGALPETLLEAEIFGARKGAYTGAVENRPGRLEQAQGGTFFLDEIGDLPLQLQVKLLRVLENYEYQPLGAKNPQKADVRFIVATHQNLEEMVEKGTFRRDLYFRINIVTINIPPLRERREDIPLLLDMALQRFNLLYGKRIRQFSPDILKYFLNHDFPGNVRELLHLVEQAVILCKGEEIELGHLPENFLKKGESHNLMPKHSYKGPHFNELLEVITRNKGNRIAAAEELGVDRTTLWRWLKKSGLDKMALKTHVP
jgi:PAS domain S-box-containing protein